MRILEGWAEIDEVDRFLGSLNEVGAAHDSAVQAMDARYIAGTDHLAAAVDRATRAFDRGDTIADDLAIEILCYAAGRRQIERAMEIGVRPGRIPVGIVVAGGDEAGAVRAIRRLVAEEQVIGPERDDAEIAAYFNITDRERRVTDAGLEALVIERVSLLAVDK